MSIVFSEIISLGFAASFATNSQKKLVLIKPKKSRAHGDTTNYTGFSLKFRKKIIANHTRSVLSAFQF